MRVGYIGLGIMGSRMAANLLRKGHELTVWNRTAARAEELLRAGAKWAHTPAELAAGSEVVCLCIADPPAMEAVSEGLNGFLGRLAPGTLVIDFSTMGPEVTRRLDAACRARGAKFLESPVTGSKNLAASGGLLLMCGGPEETFAAAQPVLQAVGAKAVYIGEVGQASQVKLIGNLIVAHMVEALSEGAALATKAGVPMDKLLDVVQGSAYASPYWEFKGKALAARDFSTHFSIDLMHKDLTLALRLGDTLGVPLPGTAAIREVYQLARAQGLGRRDVIATAVVIDPALTDG
jgi:3-hydroxyisobutyrate dehydrogenase